MNISEQKLFFGMSFLNKMPWKSVITSCITLIVFGILFSRIDFRQTMSLLVTIKPGYLISAVILSFLSNIILPTEEWRLILKALGAKVPFRKLLFMKLGVAPIKNAVPLKSGEFLRVLCLKKISGISFSLGLLSVLLSLVFGLLVLFAVALAGCIYSGRNPYNISYISFAGFVLTFLGMIFFGKIAGDNSILRFLGNFSIKISSGSKKLSEVYSSLSLSGLILPFILGFIIKLSELAVFNLIFIGLGVEIPLQAIIIFVPVTMLVSVLPIALLGLGVREGVIVLLFSVYASPEIVLSGGLLFSFIDYVLPAATGGIFTRRLLGKLLRDVSLEGKGSL